MREALELVSKHNMCTYYLLPLLGLNKFSFGVSSNFKNCYVNKEGTEVSVTVYYLLTTLKDHPYLIRTEVDNRQLVYVFKLIPKWMEHFELYKTGQYSKFSQETKEIIINKSGLKYKQLGANGVPSTDLRLMAIDPDRNRRNILRKKLMEYLETYIPEDAELISPPPPESFATFNTLTV